MSLAEINFLEAEMLNLLRFELYVSSSTYSMYLSGLISRTDPHIQEDPEEKTDFEKPQKVIETGTARATTTTACSSTEVH